MTPKSSKNFARAWALSLILLAGAVGGLLGFSSHTVDAATCERQNFDCDESGPIRESRCYNYDCSAKCIECNSGCVSSGCCYHEWMECPTKPYMENFVRAVICGGACLQTFDWE